MAPTQPVWFAFLFSNATGTQHASHAAKSWSCYYRHTSTLCFCRILSVSGPEGSGRLTSAVDLDARVENADAQVGGVLIDPVLQGEGHRKRRWVNPCSRSSSAASSEHVQNLKTIGKTAARCKKVFTPFKVGRPSQ